MSLLDNLAVKPLLIAVVVLLVTLGACGVRMHVLGADREAAVARADAADTKAKAAEQRSANWQRAANDYTRASNAWHDVAEHRNALLTEAQGENARLTEDNRIAVARIKADAVAARAAAERWRRQAQPILSTDRCQAALTVLARDCPVGSY